MADPISILPLRSDAEAEVCARMMSSSEPWISLGVTYEAALRRTRDETKERYAAHAGSEIAGLLIVDMKGSFPGYIQIVCVQPSRRGRGIGTKLVRFAEERIFRDSANAFLCVSVSNSGARRLYERLGFSAVGELPDYLARGHTEILMRKTSGPIFEFLERRGGLEIRPASAADVEPLRALLRESVVGLGGADYTVEQLGSALTHLFGVDTRLIDDGTYFVVEEPGRPEPLACGGWSRRRTLFGGDQYSDRSDDRLDPATEAARIRAFFVHPAHARRGIGRMLMEECERAARADGFRRMELMATLTGIPLYARGGFVARERVELTLPDGVRFPLVRMERDLV